MRKIFILVTFFIFSLIFCKNITFAADNLAEKLSGRILLQTEKNGEAWYVNPIDLKKYYLSRPEDAFALMRKLGIGIKNSDLEKIPNDKNFTNKNLGRIFLQVESKGEAWYLDPISKNRYYLARPTDALSIMRRFSLGITNADLGKIETGLINISAPIITPSNPPVCTDCGNTNADAVMSGAASAIRANNKEKAASYFIPEMKKAIEYTMDFLDADGRLTLGNILSGSILSDSTDTKKTYSNEVYFSLGGYKVPLKFYVEKQADGKWLLSNL
ncbi:MAG: hypothetical protein US83_C0005G0074 [Candidatus Falkowbacteria bacterium GW2011_GWC2_38_22]|uniref:Uncharacterized protein n=1 Tax=Candidatus Falkowbacteria bacterium GW2011_GWE1_38_31 TaxID=1618638 RepID=A0A0G0K4E1_9BACT|nr:MAG: hypothetical protein US73_C0003G0020 [Candidatus Falkowbacteria bacterium GW2011_GWF2_38_1205]KKQ61561.1 MAG: hypothetical protein US83_C0005G0074 [Candidatus Falkowbacteria bacterium GW2011_GWC2_38_22]KKQ63546.1 MAG: hypothetical protein US84_C0005G0020 [Candidatus Falkowbacteria bacterium GW2011_GWF1_38_22]KKQ65698.1 MAG: hypothetical protein US87_C0005G0020 [Candidatus Falkowbacteria bacterium GW2011_GWE2_38_254]KKQ70315.1 MAG: hypothetical protein US91_C0005G0020 [Candidatus Falkowb